MKTAEQKRDYARLWRARNPEKSAAISRRYAEKNREREKQRCREYRERYPERRKEICLKTKYGISEKEYAGFLQQQAGVCAICKTPPDFRRLCVDHDHKTGDVRGLLCRNCNCAIGLLKDSTELLDKAKNYLLQSKETNVRPVL